MKRAAASLQSAQTVRLVLTGNNHLHRPPNFQSTCQEEDRGNAELEGTSRSCQTALWR
jgi:hypothetical protein